MVDPRGSVRAAGPPGCVLHPEAARRVSPDAFLRGASIAWAHLQPEERKAIRATCRNGRQLHDRLITDLRITLGPDQREGQAQQHQPSPLELRVLLGAVVWRGARLQSLRVWFRSPIDGRRQAQLLAALEGCSGCPLTRLELEGDVPLSGAVAEAVGACCPQLSSLHLTGVRCHLPLEGPHRGEVAAEYHYGYSQLLTLCGPRLQELCLTGTGTEHWRALSYMALRRCTALTRLELQAPEWTWTSFGSGNGEGDRAMHASTLEQLTALRSLHLTYNAPLATPETVLPQATCVARLSALTALTHLQLVPSWCYEDHGDDWLTAGDMGSSPEEVAEWCEVAEAHRAALLSALRCMPQLQSLESAKMWLRPSELLPLTALTSLTLAGLLPPGAGHPSVPAWTRPGGRLPAGAALPPQLHTLDLRDGASPRALALLQPSPAFVRLSVSCMHFGMSDVDADGRPWTETVEAVGPAVRLILAYRDPAYQPSCYRYGSIEGFTIAGRSEGHVCPREGSLTGHTEWIRQLQGLGDAFDRIVLEGIDLSSNPADVSCLGHTLCNLKELALPNCEVPVTSLPLLRCPMLRLTRLVLDLGGSECEDMNTAALVPLLMLLCKPHAGAAPLLHLEGTGCPGSLDVDQCKRSLEEQLQQCYGVTDVSINLTHG